MTLQTWWLFAVTTFLVSSTPGPNMLHILTRSVGVGFWRTLPAMAGCAVASALLMAAAAAGIGAVLVASPAAFEAIRLVGILYLIWLGIQAWRAAGRMSSEEAAAVAPLVSRRAIFAGGFLVSATNPKLLLFSTAYIPQFIEPTAPEVPQLVLIVATFILGELFWYCFYAASGEKLAAHLIRPALRRAFDRATGALFVVFGLVLLRA